MSRIDRIRSLAVAGLLFVAIIFAAAIPAVEAAQDLKITNYNIAQLVPNSYWTPYGSSYLLGWNRGQYLDATKVYRLSRQYNWLY